MESCAPGPAPRNPTILSEHYGSGARACYGILRRPGRRRSRWRGVARLHLAHCATPHITLLYWIWRLSKSGSGDPLMDDQMIFFDIRIASNPIKSRTSAPNPTQKMNSYYHFASILNFRHADQLWTIVYSLILWCGLDGQFSVQCRKEF